jgi:Papain-like cysteine protease AvrRpt2
MVMQPQENDNWCWAAVAVSVAHYFDSNTPWTQTALAAKVVPTDPCKAEPNCPEPLQTALAAVGRLKGPPKTDSLSFNEVQTAIDAGLPLCVRVGWFGGGGHFVAVDGVGSTPTGDPLVHVKDPFYGDSTMNFNDFYQNYLGAGAWTATFPVGE